MAIATSGNCDTLISLDLNATNSDKTKLTKKLKVPIKNIPNKVKTQSAIDNSFAKVTKATPKVPAENVMCLISKLSPKKAPITELLPKKKPS